jgi:hypothetical protein
MATGLEPVIREGLRLGNVSGGGLTRVRVVGADGPVLLAEGTEDVELDVRER